MGYSQIRKKADAAQIFAANFDPSGCGCGYTYTVPNENGHTLTAVKKSCAYGYHSSAHGNGHNTHYNYGYGWLIGHNSGYRTCMAYNNPGYSTRLGRFSNPRLFYNDDRTGDVEEGDNARVITDNRFLMAEIGDESQSC